MIQPINPTPIFKNETLIGAIARNSQGNWEGFLLADDNTNYVPLSAGNQPEFSQPTHATEAVTSEHRTIQRRAARRAARPDVGDRVTLPADGEPDPTRWVASTVDHTGITVGHLDYEIEDFYTWADFDALIASR